MAQEELALLFRLLKYSNGDLPKCGPFKEALPAPTSDMYTLINIGTKIDHRNIYSLLSYCLNALGNKKARLAAESDLMGLLIMLCSRSDDVAHFHHEKDVTCFLEEVQDLLSVDNDCNESGGVISTLCRPILFKPDIPPCCSSGGQIAYFPLTMY